MKRNALSPDGETFVIMDANVLIPPRLSDILFDLALAGLYYPHWTAEIEAEFLKNWPIVVGQTIVDVAQAQHRLSCFRNAIPGYQVLGHMALIGQVPANVNAKDRHVAAAGLALRDYSEDNDEVLIVSSNVKDLAKANLAAMGVEVVRPGEFVDRLYAARSSVVEGAMRQVVGALAKPPYTRDQLLSVLKLHGASATAAGLEATWRTARQVKKVVDPRARRKPTRRK